MPITKITWDEYSKEFSIKAREKQLSVDQIEDLLNYAHVLYNKRVPIIYNQQHFSRLVGYKVSYLERVYRNTPNFYRVFEIPKKNGGTRLISEPLPSLKEIQLWILNFVLYNLDCNVHSKAYRKGFSIKDNAKFHKNQEVVLSLDIENYFPSITIDKVFTFFLDVGYSRDVANLLSNICCLNDSLPQGSPTSPYLSNLITKVLDEDLGLLAQETGIRYTRYADDITFSGQFKPGFIINKVKALVEKNGYYLNDSKIRFKEKHEQQLVTGIIVNNTRLTVPKSKRKELRQHIYYIKKFGLVEHINRRKINRKNFLGYLLGLTNFFLHINSKDSEVISYRIYIISLMNDYDI